MKEKRIQKAQPQPVKKIVCPSCGDLQLKIYPWSAYVVPEPINNCRKCQDYKKRPFRPNGSVSGIV